MYGCVESEAWAVVVIRLGKDVTVVVVVAVVVVAHGAGLDGEVGAKVGPTLHRPAESAETTASILGQDKKSLLQLQYRQHKNNKEICW